MGNFNLSKNKFIKFIQMLSFITMFIFVLILLFFIITVPIFIDSSVNESLIKVIIEIGSTIFILSVTCIIAKRVINSPMPVMQKVILIMGGYLASLIIYSIILFTYFYIFGDIKFNVIIIIKHTFELFFIISFIVFYLDDFKFNENKLIKYIQIFTFICTPFILFILSFTSFIDIIYCVKEGDNNIHLHGHVSVDKDTGKAIGQGINTGMNTIGNIIGNK
jgi:hypothetical protein